MLANGYKGMGIGGHLPVSRHGIHLQVIIMARGQAFSETDDSNNLVGNTQEPNFDDARLPKLVKTAALNGEPTEAPRVLAAAGDEQAFEMPKPDPEAIRQVEALAAGLRKVLSSDMSTQLATQLTKLYMEQNVNKMFEKAADAYPELPFQGMVGALNKALKDSGYSAGIVETFPLEGDLVIRKGNQIIYRGP